MKLRLLMAAIGIGGGGLPTSAPRTALEDAAHAFRTACSDALDSGEWTPGDDIEASMAVRDLRRAVVRRHQREIAEMTLDLVDVAAPAVSAGEWRIRDEHLAAMTAAITASIATDGEAREAA